MNLILFSSTYPFDGGAEQTFLDPELKYLCRAFERVVLVPKKIVGNCLPLPEGVTVDKSYASLLSRVKLLSLFGEVFSSSLIYRELLDRPALMFYPHALMRMTRFLAVAKLTSHWVEAWLDRNYDGTPNVFYTYWFDSNAFGIGLAKRHYPDLRLVSRIHGYDLYEEYYYNPPYWPFRRVALSFLEALFPDSDAGLRYLLRAYPEYSSTYETGLLGVTDPGFETASSTDGVFRIISCSMLVPVKRIDLLFEGILHAARRRPHQHFEWTHLGNGSARSELQESANRRFPNNAKVSFPGYSTREALMRLYRENPIDVFINVSSTEGTPVAAMEAASCSIPIVATSVGGNSEIVSEKNGILLDANPTPEMIANALLKLWDNPSLAARLKTGSRQVWQTNYNADVNFRVFAERLKSIGKSSC